MTGNRSWGTTSATPSVLNGMGERGGGGGGGGGWRKGGRGGRSDEGVVEVITKDLIRKIK